MMVLTLTLLLMMMMTLICCLLLADRACTILCTLLHPRASCTGDVRFCLPLRSPKNCELYVYASMPVHVRYVCGRSEATDTCAIHVSGFGGPHDARFINSRPPRRQISPTQPSSSSSWVRGSADICTDISTQRVPVSRRNSVGAQLWISGYPIHGTGP